MAARQRVYKLRMNDRAFSILAKAAYFTTLETKRIESIPSLLLRLIITFDSPTDNDYNVFREGEPYSGDQIVIGNIEEQTSQLFDRLKEEICRSIRRECTILETVMFLAL